MENAIASLPIQLLGVQSGVDLSHSAEHANSGYPIEFKGFITKEAGQNFRQVEKIPTAEEPSLVALPPIDPNNLLVNSRVNSSTVLPGTANTALSGGIALPPGGRFLPQYRVAMQNAEFSNSPGSKAVKPLVEEALPRVAAQTRAQTQHITAAPDAATPEFTTAIPDHTGRAQVPIETVELKQQSLPVQQATIEFESATPAPGFEASRLLGEKVNSQSKKDKLSHYTDVSNIQKSVSAENAPAYSAKAAIPSVVEPLSVLASHAFTAGPMLLSQSNPLALAASNIDTQSTAYGDIGLSKEGIEEPLARQVSLLLVRGQQQARLMLNPPELGGVDVKLELQEGDVKLNLLTQTPAARELLEAALPRLREVMSESGMNLLEANVSERDSSQLKDTEQHGENEKLVNEKNSGDESLASTKSSDSGQKYNMNISSALVDVFA